MTQAAQIEIGVSRLKAIGDLKAIRKELQKLTTGVGKLNKQWQGLGTSMKKGTKATTKAKTSMEGLRKSSGRTSRQVRGLSGKMRDLSQSATLAIGPLSGVGARLSALSVLFSTAGLAMAALLVTFVALGLTLFKGAKLFKNYEVALAKIAKTTDLTESEVKSLGRTLRRAAVETGIARGELLAIAEAAGRLGITGVANLELFAVTMGMVATATNLTGEQAATSFARILIVTGEAASSVGRLADVIVQLGNNVAAEESEITEFATAVARATGIFGVSSAEAAALGAVFAEFGQKSEASATALNKVFGSFGAVLARGGRPLRNLEQLTQSTAASLRTLLKTDPTAFFEKFIQGLNRLSAQKGTNKVVETLADFGIAGVREAKALLPLIDNVEELVRVLKLASDEFETGGATAEEFGKRQDTLQGDIDKLKESFEELLLVFTGERFNDLLRGIAQGLAGALNTLVTGASDARKVFGEELGGIEAIGITTIRTMGKIFGFGADFEKGFQADLKEFNAGLKATEDQLDATKKAADDAKLAEKLAVELTITTKFVDDLTTSLINLGEETAALLGADNGFEFITPEQVRALNQAEKAMKKLQVEDIPGIVEALDDQNLLLGEAGDLIRDMVDNWDDLDDAAKEFAKDTLAQVNANLTIARDEAKKLAKVLEKTFDTAASSFVGAFRNAFKEAFSGTAVKNVLGSFASTLKKTFTDLFADILTQQLTRSLIAPLFKDIGTSLGFSGGALDASIGRVTGLQPGDTATGGLVGGFGNIITDFSLSVNRFGKSLGFTKQIDTFVSSSERVNGELVETMTKSTVAVGNLTSRLVKSFAVQQVFGNQGALSNVIGTLAGTALGAIGKKIGEAAGKAVGGALGSALGPIGAIVGELLGGLIGKLFSKTPAAFATFGAVGGGAALGIVGTRTQGKGAPLDETISSTNSLIKVLNSIAVELGTSFTGLQATFSIQKGKTPFESEVGGVKKRFLSGQEALLDLVKRFIFQGGFAEIPPAVKKVVQNSLNSDLEQLFKDIQFAIIFENAFGVLDSLLTDVERSVKELNKTFDENVRTAKKLGLAEERVNAAREVAILQLRGGFEDDIKGAILALTDPLEAALFEQGRVEEERLKNAAALGASITAVELLGQLERQQILEQFANSATDTLSSAFRTIQDFLTEITATTSSKLPLTQVLAAAQSRFTDLRATFLGGDTSVADALVEASRQLLDLTRRAEASGPGFFSTQALVEDTLRKALLVDDELNLSELQLEALNAINASIGEGNARLAQLVAILSQPSSGNDGPGTVPPNQRTPGGGGRPVSGGGDGSGDGAFGGGQFPAIGV